MAVGVAERVLAALAILVSGCAARDRGATAPPPPCERGACASAFPVTRDMLDREIRTRAEALREGPLGARAGELASLRLAAAGADLLDAGSPAGAQEALEHALAEWPGNAWARLFLAEVHSMSGRRDAAAALAAEALPGLPDSSSVRAEVDRLVRSLHDGADVRTAR